jgi:hypothetical protein
MHIPTFLVSITIACCVAGVISYFTDFNFWVLLGITVAAMLITGYVAELEDNSSDGFNKPSDRDTK